MYTVRFYVELELLGETLDTTRFIKDSIYSSKQTEYILFIDTGDSRLWFQANLPFVPTLGTKLSNISTARFWWEKETLPMIVDIEYSFKHQMFFVGLDWGLDNQIDLLRRVYVETLGGRIDA